MSFVDELERHLKEGIEMERRRRARRRRAALAGSALVAAGLAIAVTRSFLDTEPPTQLATEGEETTTTTTTVGVDQRPTSETILPAPEPPLEDPADPIDSTARSLGLFGTVTLRTGSELFVWGGGTGYERGAARDNPGLRYDLASDTWQELPPAPGGPQIEAVGVWTGTEVIVCCGRTADGGAGGAIAYNPSADTWRELALPPLSEPAGAVWLDDRLYVMSGFVTASYDPATDTWERLTMPPGEVDVSPSASVVAVEDAIVVWPLQPSRTVSHGFVYDPPTDTWSELPAPPEEFHPAMADVAWTGDELIVVGGLPAPLGGDSQRLVGARLDWATLTWRPLPDVWPEPLPGEGNLGSASIVWTGDVAVVAASLLGSGVDPIDGAIAAYNPLTDRWRRLETPGGWAWNPSLIAAGDEVLAISGGRAHRIRATADAGVPVDDSGLPTALTPPLTDIPVRDVPITLVGTNGNGGGITVLDLDHGVRTVYESGRHHRLGGALTDLAMSDEWLYVWNTDEPTVRFPNGVTSFDLDRLTYGELSQPGEVVQADEGERAVLPVPSMDLLWSWEVEAVPGGFEATARLLPLGSDPEAEALVEMRVDDHGGPWGASSGGHLVMSDDTTATVLTIDGRLVDLGSGTVLAVVGDEVLIQRCTAEGCQRRRVDTATGRLLRVAPDDERWLTAGGPVIPGHSAPLNNVSPDGSQILVATEAPNPGSFDLLRVDLATEVTEVVPLPDGLGAGALATWSRSGRHVVVVNGGDVIVADLRTGLVKRHPSVIPDGYFVLAAG